MPYTTVTKEFEKCIGVVRLLLALRRGVEITNVQNGAMEVGGKMSLALCEYHRHHTVGPHTSYCLPSSSIVLYRQGVSAGRY